MGQTYGPTSLASTLVCGDTACATHALCNPPPRSMLGNAVRPAWDSLANSLKQFLQLHLLKWSPTEEAVRACAGHPG